MTLFNLYVDSQSVLLKYILSKLFIVLFEKAQSVALKVKESGNKFSMKFEIELDSYVRSSNYALLAIAEMSNDELTSIHTLSLPPLHL